MRKSAKANVTPIRQTTQYSCCAASLVMCLNALGIKATEDQVNEVMGAAPMRGASWEQIMAAAQYFGLRGNLVIPATLQMLRTWTQMGYPVMISWNPEGRKWSHASVVFDVDDQDNVYIADPNCPDPNQTVRIVSSEDFHKRWAEDWDRFMVRRPALCLTREVMDGRQVVASRGQVDTLWVVRDPQPGQTANQICGLISTNRIANLAQTMGDRFSTVRLYRDELSARKDAEERILRTQPLYGERSPGCQLPPND